MLGATPLKVDWLDHVHSSALREEFSDLFQTLASAQRNRQRLDSSQAAIPVAEKASDPALRERLSAARREADRVKRDATIALASFVERIIDMVDGDSRVDSDAVRGARRGLGVLRDDVAELDRQVVV